MIHISHNSFTAFLLGLLSISSWCHVAVSFVPQLNSIELLRTRQISNNVLFRIDMGTDNDAEDDDDYDDDELTMEDATSADQSAVNVLGTALAPCCTDVAGTGIGTGFYRNGYCSTGEQDLGRHTVCCQVTDEFLKFSASAGNDLSTPAPQYLFPGLKEGDIWCLCAQRWAQAYNAGMAPKIFLQATHEKTLDYAPFEILREFAIDRDEADRRLDDLNEQRDKLNKLL